MRIEINYVQGAIQEDGRYWVDIETIDDLISLTRSVGRPIEMRVYDGTPALFVEEEYPEVGW